MLALVGAVLALIVALGRGWSVEVLGVVLPPRTFLDLAQLVALILPIAAIIHVGLYQGLRSRDVRRGVGVLWDLGGFWPRWVHPFAPPTYSDRAVTRLQEQLNERTEAAPVLLAPHSQGTVIAAAAVLGADADRVQDVALLTYGSPLARLYAELYPAVFSRACFAALVDRLTNDDGHVRWRNLFRVTDPIGGAIDPVVTPAHVDAPQLADPHGRYHGAYWAEPVYDEAAAYLQHLLLHPDVTPPPPPSAPAPEPPADGSDFTPWTFRDHDIEHRVLTLGVGPAVVILHEAPGLSTSCLGLARELVAAGYRVSVPVLAGKPGESSMVIGSFRTVFCLRKEMALLRGGRTSPLSRWLGRLADRCAEDAGHPRAAVIGMCLTGGLVLGTLTEARVGAAVASQPSAPFLDRADLGLSPEDLLAAQASTTPVLALRFQGDRISPSKRMAAIRAELATSPPVAAQDGDVLIHECGRLTTVEVAGGKHSVLTQHRHGATVDRVKAFLAAHLGSAAQ